MLVVRPGPLSLIQDEGRPGLAAMGVGRSGAADRASYALANRLVGHPAGAAVVETTFGGLVIRAGTDLVIAVTGAFGPLTIDGRTVEHHTPLGLSAGQELAIKAPTAGLRSYLAVRGGVQMPATLGSRSADTLAGLGPAALRRGDTLPVGAAPPVESTDRTTESSTVGPVDAVIGLRVRLGPRDDWFTDPSALAAGDWVVSANSNRVGLRLDRPQGDEFTNAQALRRKDSGELPSEGLVPGAIQVPPSGQPVLFLADHPVTGGYPVIGVVLDADVDLAAQARPGQRLRFVIERAGASPDDR